MKKKKPRKPKSFERNLLTVKCNQDYDYRDITIYANGTYTKLNDLKKFHAALGKAIEWVGDE